MNWLYPVFFGISFLAAWGLTPLVRSLGIRFGILDLPGKRKVHQYETPRLGGLAVFAATLLPFLIFLFWGDFLTEHIKKSWEPFWGLILGCLIVFLIGIWDDIRRLSPWPKLIAEIVASSVAFYFGLRIQLLSNPLGMQWDVSWLSGPLTVIWLVGITNAVNLADGIDGLAAGIATFAAAILFVMTVPSIYTLVPLMAVALTGATLGFLRYNFSPATIFLGDSGSLFLGFYLGGLSLWASEKSTIAFGLLIPIIALGLPIIDMIYAIIRRWHRGVPLGQADRDHIHHILLEKGYSHRKAVLMLYGVNSLLALTAALLLFTRKSFAAYIVIAMSGLFILVTRFLGYYKFSKIFRDMIKKWKDSQQAKYLAFRTRFLRRAFEDEKTLGGRWKLVKELFEEVGIQQATIEWVAQPERLLVWFAHTPVLETDKTVIFSIPLTGEVGPLGHLEIIWNSTQGVFPPGVSKVLNLMANEFCQGLQDLPSNTKTFS
jgi:UDP-GlcNAc:undecaprenyl-phosphate/decaprenyl-phosphate GlcNAc-1-phosphate transferase